LKKTKNKAAEDWKQTKNAAKKQVNLFQKKPRGSTANSLSFSAIFIIFHFPNKKH
jgi:hypothetical protein